MLCDDLFEDAEKDLSTVRYAQRAIGKIWRYLTDKTESTPLEDAGFLNIDVHTGGAIDEIWMFPVTDAGLPHQNVRFAVGWRKSNLDTKSGKTQAYVTTGRDRTGQYILLVYLLDHDPSTDTDVAWKMNFSDLVHEFIHVLDHRRGYMTHKDNIRRSQAKLGPKFKGYNATPTIYFNSAIEFNAYYQQGVESVLNALVIASYKVNKTPTYAFAYRSSVLSSYAQFQREFRLDFNDAWMRHFTPETKQRFIKRFYQLYLYVRQHWPDMDAIRDMAAENAESAARLQAADKMATAA